MHSIFLALVIVLPGCMTWYNIISAPSLSSRAEMSFSVIKLVVVFAQVALEEVVELDVVRAVIREGGGGAGAEPARATTLRSFRRR